MLESDMRGFKLLDKVIGEGRIEKRRPRTKPWDTTAERREGGSNIKV